MGGQEAATVWERLREYAGTQRGSFTSQEVVSWFGRHASEKANDRTVRTHVRGACWNVGNRSRFSHREPFLTRIDRGLFRLATPEEVAAWRATHQRSSNSSRNEMAGRSAAVHEPSASTPRQEAGGPASTVTSRPEEWHTEANVQAAAVTALVTAGWRIHSVANTTTKEHGIDVVASRDGQTVGIEVKGFPSRHYADPSRADQIKRTSPSTQAGHWFSQAVLAAMRLRGKEPEWRSVIVLPDFPRYRDLHRETAGSLAAANIEVWWIDATGGLNPT